MSQYNILSGITNFSMLINFNLLSDIFHWEFFSIVVFLVLSVNSLTGSEFGLRFFQIHFILVRADAIHTYII